MLVSTSVLPDVAGKVGFGWIVAGPSNLYFSTYVTSGTPSEQVIDGSAMRIPFEGGAPEQLIAGYLFRKPLLTQTNLLLAGSGVPSSDGDTILSVPLSGGPVTTIAMLDEPIFNGFATDGTYIYFSDMGGVKARPIAPSSGGAGVISLVSTLPDIIGVFGATLLIADAQGVVENVLLPPRADAIVVSRGTCPPGPSDLMRCGGAACWLAGNTVQVLDPSDRVPRTVMVSGAGSEIVDAAFDSTYAYVIGSELGAAGEIVERVPLDGGATVVLASIPASGSGAVAVDDACVYWSSPEGIFSLAKTSNGSMAQ